MATLHIEHHITDLSTWTAAFVAFATVRREAGVTAETVRHPLGDDTSVVIDLEFRTSEQTHAFLHFLQTQVWAAPQNSPALAGTPRTSILETVRL
jgi:hypothetical protein